MTRSEVSGWLLLASAALWLAAASLPSRIWTASLPERLLLISEHRRRWQVVNLSISAATVLLVLGFVALARPLERSGGGVVVPLSLAALVLGAGLWLACLTFRMTALVDPAATAPEAALALASAWVGGLFVAWSVLGNAAVVGFSAAIVRSGYPAAWCGWAAVVLGVLLLAQLAVTGDALPALYHVGPALIGIALLLD